MHLAGSSGRRRMRRWARSGTHGYTASIHRRRAFSLVLGVILGMLVASCSGGDSPSESGMSSGPNGASSPKTAPARATVLRLWSEIRSGSPTLTSEYDPRLLRLLGTDLILTVFDIAPPEYLAPPRVKEARQVSSGILVRVEGKGPGQPDPVPVSFLVSKVSRRWLIRYDSNLINRVRGQVLAEAQLGLPRTKATQDKAEAMANQAVLEARALFADGPRKGTLPPR